MFNDESGNQPGIARLLSDLRAAKVELPNQQCAIDRLRRQHCVTDIVSFGEPQSLKSAITSAESLCPFFSSVEHQMKQAERQQ